jgi:FHS family L-fucose permease-like MFS transporter
MSQKQNSNAVAIVMMILLFGMISFVTNLAAPMGVVLKNQFGVSNFMGMLGNAANFIAYAVMGIPSGILLQRIGYKKTALTGVAIGFVGVGIQYLSGNASDETAFGIYLLGAFVAGFSMCLLNTVVNPMLNTLGGGGKGGGRLIQVGGSFNSLMATFTPVFVGILIGEVSKAKITDVFPVMYIAMGVFAAVFFVLWAVKIAEPNVEKTSDPLGKLMAGTLKFRHFVLGAIAIFVYVGVEVGTPGIANLYMTTPTSEQAQAKMQEYDKQQSDSAYLLEIQTKDEENKDKQGYALQEVKKEAFDNAKKIIDGETMAGLGIPAGVAGGVVGLYWLLMLVGRLTGAIIGKKVSSKTMLTVASVLGLALIAAAIFTSVKPLVLMPSFSTGNGTLEAGLAEVPLKFLFIALVGLCTSIMWGGIFNLAVEGLGKYLAAASGIFMVLVCGGGLLPALQGFIADIAGYSNSYWVIMAGLAYLLFYALVGSKIVNKDIPVK